jgi:hypothetical protein
MHTQLSLALEAATTQCQRWINRKVRYRPPGEVFNPSRAEVVSIHEKDARAFIEQHHYSHSYQKVLALKLEGMVAKRAGSLYVGGKNSDWLKIKRPGPAPRPGTECPGSRGRR